MPESFQSTRHRKSAYNRPEQRWICGGECKDCPCFLGPDSKGNCQAGTEFDGRKSGQCLPRKSADRWLCTRQDTHGGEPCETGPLPDGSCCMSVPVCRPKRSLRSKRGIFTIALSLATCVWLVAILAPKADPDTDPMSGLNAGQLSANHSHIANQCYRCHSNEELPVSALLDIHGTASHHRAIEDGKLCLSCHNTVGGPRGEFAFNPHTAGDLSPDSMAPQKSGALIMAVASSIASNHLTDGGIHCATCHQEHHGEEFNIATLSDRQCQVCHKNQFESFSNGHPEFTQSRYPYSRRSGIFFDHYSHYQTHFGEELKSNPETVPEGFDPASLHSESVSCTSCHSAGKTGEPMSVKPFEASCAACHTKNTFSGTPLTFLASPAINLIAVNERLAESTPPRSIGTWTDSANSIPWPTLYLLDKDARDAWARLNSAGINPFDAAAEIPNDPAAIKDIETIAWAVKELIRDLAQNFPHENPSNLIGHDELTRRLRESGFDDPEALVKGLPPGAFDAILQGFSKDSYIKLIEEVDAKRQGNYPPAVTPPTPEPAPDETTGTAPAGEEDFNGGEETFGEGESTFDGGEESFGEGEETFGGGEESFGEGEETFGGGEESFGDEEFGTEENKEEKPEPKELEPIDPINWAAQGGWYQQFGKLYYRSTGHADPLIKNWLDQTSKKIDSPLALAHFKDGFDFRSGVESSSSGSCLKCHVVDEIRDESGKLTGARINWRSVGKDATRHTLTRYDHATHLLLTDCRSCHQTITKDPAYTNSFPTSEHWNEKFNWTAKADPLKFMSNFKAIKKQTCSECHQSGKAGDSCIQCHLYHKTFSAPVSLPTESR